MPKKSGSAAKVHVYFSEVFEVAPAALKKYGAFDVSVVADLPLFIDPFLLFQSDDPTYKRLHARMIAYLEFLRKKSKHSLSQGLVKAWFMFPEVKQNWFGYSKSGNKGRGLGRKFARNLNANLYSIFSSFGKEQITSGTHLEKVCLINSGVGRDNISDFTTNLIKDFLLDYTAKFAKRYIDPTYLDEFTVEKVSFDYDTESWRSKKYTLPAWRGDYVLLTPRNLLTKDETWISRTELVDNFKDIVASMPNDALRAQISNYIQLRLDRSDDKRSAEKVRRVRVEAIEKYPAVIEYYIQQKELEGEEAPKISAGLIDDFKSFVIERAKRLVKVLDEESEFYEIDNKTCQQARKKLKYLKHVLEERDGYRIFWDGTQPIRRESDLQTLFLLTWEATRFDINREVNNGRGPVDFKISDGAKDKCLVEMKLASNSQLKKNLEHQTAIYQKANKVKKSLKAILYFDEQEKRKVEATLKELKLESSPDVVLIDARRDNKPSASKATES
jgi:hypothetical protein